LPGAIGTAVAIGSLVCLTYKSVNSLPDALDPRPSLLVIKFGNRQETRAAYGSPVTTQWQLAVDDPRRPDVQELLARHREFALGQTPPEHSFTLDAGGLLDPAVTLLSLRLHGSLLGIGAIRRIDSSHAEIKSMHTAEAARGQGIGRAILSHLLDVARSEGLRQVSLETGTTPGFAPARALYRSAGFVPCDPFGDYQPSQDNFFMTIRLTGQAVLRSEKTSSAH
jgi:putative acetyltransferase